MKPTLIWLTVRHSCSFVLRVFFDLKVYGAKNVPRTGGVLLLSNHQSYLDPAVLASHLPRMISYFAKSELFTNRYFGWLIRSLNAFPVQQGKGDTRAIKETIARLREGHILNIFPEGSRTDDGQIGPIEGGAAVVLRHLGSDVPVIPVAIDGSFESWPNFRKLPRPHPIHAMFGPPLNVAGKSRQQIIDLIQTTLSRMLADLRAQRRAVTQ